MASDYLFLLCHLGSLLETCAFFQTDMLRLRVLELAAKTMIAVYSILHANGDYTDCHFIWAVFHALINGTILVTYAYRYISVSISDEERTLLDDGGIFNIFPRAQFAFLQQTYTWVDIPPGETLLTYGNEVESLYLLVKGRVSIRNKLGHKFANVEVGTKGHNPQFVGELSFFTGKTASATVVADSAVRAIRWNMKEVRTNSCDGGHGVKASVFRQLPSLFSKQIAKRLATDERHIGKLIRKSHMQITTGNGLTTPSWVAKSHSRKSMTKLAMTQADKAAIPPQTDIDKMRAASANKMGASSSIKSLMGNVTRNSHGIVEQVRKQVRRTSQLFKKKKSLSQVCPEGSAGKDSLRLRLSPHTSSMEQYSSESTSSSLKSEQSKTVQINEKASCVTSGPPSKHEPIPSPRHSITSDVSDISYTSTTNSFATEMTRNSITKMTRKKCREHITELTRKNSDMSDLSDISYTSTTYPLATAMTELSTYPTSVGRDGMDTMARRSKHNIGLESGLAWVKRLSCNDISRLLGIMDQGSESKGWAKLHGALVEVCCSIDPTFLFQSVYSPAVQVESEERSTQFFYAPESTEEALPPGLVPQPTPDLGLSPRITPDSLFVRGATEIYK